MIYKSKLYFNIRMKEDLYGYKSVIFVTFTNCIGESLYCYLLLHNRYKFVSKIR